MGKTGVFYHPSFSKKSYMTIGNRLADFPEALDKLFKKYKEKLVMYECKKAPYELVEKIHTPQMIQMVNLDPFCSTAWHSVGCVVEACEKIMKGELKNAFSFIGAGGHHAGRNYFWGACCLNDVVLAIVNCREKGLGKRFVILDTDAHHGDGTRELIIDDKEILHLCLCDRDWTSPDGTKIDFDATDVYYSGSPDASYLSMVEKALYYVDEFKPELFFWYFGFDTYAGDYGSLGLSREVYLKIARLCKDSAEEICNGKLHVVLAGGSLRSMATWVIPKIIAILLDE